MESLTLAIIFLTIGFGAGYSARAYLSHFRRLKAREHYRQQKSYEQKQSDQPVAAYVDEDHFSERGGGDRRLDQRNSTRLNALLEVAGREADAQLAQAFKPLP